MNFFSALLWSWRHQRKLAGFTKRMEAESSSDRDAAIGKLLDYCEANPGVKAVMLSQFDDSRPYTRDDLHHLFASLRAGGLENRERVHAIATPHVLSYIARAKKRGDDWGMIIFTLKNYYASSSARLE